MSAATRRRLTLHMVLVTARDCHLCERARAVLAHLGREYRFVVNEHDIQSEQGRLLVTSHRVPFPPALFVENTLIAHGRFSERALRRALASLLSSEASTEVDRG